MLEISLSFRILTNFLKIFVVDTKQQLQGNIKLWFGTAWFTADVSGSNKRGQCAKHRRKCLNIDYNGPVCESLCQDVCLNGSKSGFTHIFILTQPSFWRKSPSGTHFMGHRENRRRAEDGVAKYPKIFAEGYTLSKQYTGLSHRHEIVT
jgi:hypothetical protein